MIAVNTMHVSGDTPGVASPVPAIAVVIVTYNSADLIDRCLDSLVAGCRGVKLVEVIISDNASSDQTLARAGQHVDNIPLRILRLAHNAGYAAGINAAVATLDPRVEAVLVLNPDITVRPGAVRVLVDALREPSRGIAVPKLLNPDGSLQLSLRRLPTVTRAFVEAVIGGDRAARVGSLGERIANPRLYDRQGPACWATGAAMLISVDVWRDIGPWDESFLLYSEETDFALRARDRGWQLWFEPAAVMEHIGGENVTTNPALFALLAVNRVRLFRQRNGHLRGAAYHAAVALGEAIRAAAGRRTARAAVVALVRPSRRLRALPE